MPPSPLTGEGWGEGQESTSLTQATGFSGYSKSGWVEMNRADFWGST